MVRLYDGSVLCTFAGPAAVIAHFALSGLSADDWAGIKAASDAGHPLHAAISPFYLEIHDKRTLLLEPDAKALRYAVEEAAAGI